MVSNRREIATRPIFHFKYPLILLRVIVVCDRVPSDNRQDCHRFSRLGDRVRLVLLDWHRKHFQLRVLPSVCQERRQFLDDGAAHKE
jgi:hypothetical protein